MKVFSNRCKPCEPRPPMALGVMKQQNETVDNFFEIVKTGYTFDDLNLVPNYSEVMSRKTLQTSEKLFGVSYELPIMSANMPKVTEGAMIEEMCRNGGTGVFHRFMSPEKLVEEIDGLDQGLTLGRFGISVGVDLVRVRQLFDALSSHLKTLGYIVLDVAHAHHKNVQEVTRFVKDHHIPLIAGNVCTGKGAKYLEDLGVDAVKCGVGPGSHCQTRTVAGVGVPQLSAIREVVESVSIPVIADGGIKTSGDIVKALAAGASFVMVGGLLAGTRETPGNPLTLADGSIVKVYGGSASIDNEVSNLGKSSKDVTPEGVSTLVKYKGRVEHVLSRLRGGLQSGMSYCGAENLRELREYGRVPSNWVKVTHSGYIEGTPHGS